MDTKQKILEEALTLFSERGFTNVFVNDIAERVGIKAPSLYKHYPGKQAIFDAIIEEMHRRFLEEAERLHIQGNDPAKDAEKYRELQEDQLVKLGIDLFLYQLHDDYTRRIRKMLTIEQFSHPELAAVYTAQYVDAPLYYHGALLGLMAQQGVLQAENTETMTIQFFAPFYLLMTVCDRDPAREKDAVRILEDHIRQFDKLYRRTI
ncbi:MAG: TetR/AcrR family transcriptional regulator [Clostridia bacterium]|jgi:AcrR family transcriptional regulator|nr:TetR/AcrR family transcriptional regulator [Clostridia bacterium]